MPNANPNVNLARRFFLVQVSGNLVPVIMRVESLRFRVGELVDHCGRDMVRCKKNGVKVS